VTPEARAARERKQKIFVVVGGLFLLALLAFQLPKLLGGSSAEATAAQATTTQTPSTPGATPSAVPAPASSGTPVAATAKLTSFTVFQRKDPFVQQVVTRPPAATAPSSSSPSGAGKTGSGTGAGGAPTPTTKFSTGAKSASATIVTVNGERQVLEPGTKFPASDPLFVLVAEKPGSKSIVVGIAGGAYQGGRKTTTLKVGKPLSLVNTATGARYRITLVSVGSGGDAGSAKPSQERP
jgi:hypothetical protein